MPRNKKKSKSSFASGFCHLHVHTEYSLLDGFGTAKQYAEVAKELGFNCLACTDHGNVDGALKFQNACTEAGIAPIFGCELYVVEDAEIKEKGEKRRHLCVFVESKKGWVNLLKLLTLANTKGFYYRPRVDPKMLLDNCEGLIFTTACASSVIVDESWGVDLIKNLVDRIGKDSVFVELMPHDYEDQITVNDKSVDLAEELGLGIIMTNDCHYPEKEDAVAQEVLLAIQRKAKWKDPDRWRFDVEGLYLKTENEMATAFEKGYPIDHDLFQECIENTSVIANRCISGFPCLEKQEVVLPKIKGHGKKTDTEIMEEIIESGYENLIAPNLPKQGPNEKVLTEKDYRERIKEEFGLICELNFQKYFLVVWELINWCRSENILTGPGRGSVGGSLVAYLMGITKVDALEYGLIFSRFISPARIDLPDIDMDFEDRKRHLVRKHLEDTYGKECVAGISTFSKLKGRAALRDVARVFDVPFSDVDKAAKSIVVRSGGDFRADYTIADAFITFEDGIAFKEKYPEVADLACKLEGQVRGTGQHAAGICVDSKDLREGTKCVLCKRGDNIVTNWDKYDSEFFGMMKLDVLGLSALSVLSKARDAIEENHGKRIEYEDLGFNDEAVFKEISAGHTVGAFQIGSPGLSKFCGELGVDDFDDLVNATSLWRPGTLRSGMTTEFQKRKKNESEWDYVHPALEPITRNTYGIILYQEQVMLLMYNLAGVGWRTCDVIRKVISKSQGDALIEQFKGEFIKGCKEKDTLGEKEAGKVWDELSSFGSYGFNRSHAVEYSMITYWDMWLKTYYPAEFLAASLTYGAKDKKSELVREARRIGLKIKPPKIDVSHPTEWVGKDNILVAPLSEIKGIGAAACKKIQKAKSKNSDKSFFKSDAEESLPSNIVSLLDRIHAYDLDYEFSDSEISDISGLFSFDISSDPMREIRGIVELIKPYSASIAEISSGKVKGKNLSVCRIDDLRFGYRKSVMKNLRKKGSENIDMAGTKENLGGVYGFCRDEFSTDMLVFNDSVYQKKKNKVEHCAGQWFIAELEKSHTNVVCSDLWLTEDLLNCDIEDLGLELLPRKKQPEIDLGNLIDKCKACDLRNKASCSPVKPSYGSHPILILGEAPNSLEAKANSFLSSTSAAVLWDRLDDSGIKRKNCFVDSVVKCCVDKTKDITQKHITGCSDWVYGLIESVRPVVVLALGNISVNAITGEKSGINTLNGTTQWMPSLKCWVCWCVSPYSASYSTENKEMFFKGVDNFTNTIERLGGLV